MSQPLPPDPVQLALEAEIRALQADLHQLCAEQRQAYEHQSTLAVLNEELQVSNEELQQANAQLVRTNEELDTFVYAASHDLRGPIHNLQGLVHELEQQLRAPDYQPGQVAPVVDLMNASLARFDQALEHLTERGTQRQEISGPRELLNLATVVDDVRQDLAPLLATTHGRLEVDLAGSASVVFAPQHLRSVIYNLVSNAFKYRPPARDPVVRVRSRREPGRLVVSVQDNGLGLSEDQQDQLFRLFRRLHAHVEGSGVGLYLVKKILDNAGGAIRVESTLGRGSTFTAILPA